MIDTSSGEGLHTEGRLALDHGTHTMSNRQCAKAQLPRALQVEQHCAIPALRSTLSYRRWNSLDERDGSAEWRHHKWHLVRSNIPQTES